MYECMYVCTYVNFRTNVQYNGGKNQNLYTTASTNATPVTLINGYMLWKAQPDDELRNKGHDENHSQRKYPTQNNL